PPARVSNIFLWMRWIFWRPEKKFFVLFQRQLLWRLVRKKTRDGRRQASEPAVDSELSVSNRRRKLYDSSRRRICISKDFRLVQLPLCSKQDCGDCLLC